MANRFCYQVNGLHLLKPGHSAMRRTRKTHSLPDSFNKRNWNSGLLLMDYLKEWPLDPASKAVDISEGWGSCGLYLGKAHQAKVALIQSISGAEPFLQLHSSINKIAIDYQNSTPENISEDLLKTTDYIVAAGTCDKISKVDALFALFQKAMASGVKQILVSDPGETAFDLLCDLCEHKLPENLGVEIETRTVKLPDSAQPFTGQILIISAG